MKFVIEVRLNEEFKLLKINWNLKKLLKFNFINKINF